MGEEGGEGGRLQISFGHEEREEEEEGGGKGEGKEGEPSWPRPSGRPRWEGPDSLELHPCAVPLPCPIPSPRWRQCPSLSGLAPTSRPSGSR